MNPFEINEIRDTNNFWGGQTSAELKQIAGKMDANKLKNLGEYSGWMIEQKKRELGITR